MKKLNREKGGVGESLAASKLVEEGYEILERNFWTKRGEIDLICSKDGVLVFVEVKLKVGEEYGLPEEMVSFRKLRQVQRMADLYLLRRLGYEQFRIDAVAIVLNRDGSVERISHYENLTG